MVLELDEEVPRLERVAKRRHRASPRARAALEDLLRQVPAHARAQTHDAARVLAQHLEVDARDAADEPFHPAAADDADDVLVALLRRREQHEVMRVADRLVAPRACDEVDLAAEDRLDARGLARRVVLDRAEHVRVVGERDRSHPHVRDPTDEALQADRPIEHRELGVRVEVDELGGHRTLGEVTSYRRGDAKGRPAYARVRARSRLRGPRPRDTCRALRRAPAPAWRSHMKKSPQQTVAERFEDKAGLVAALKKLAKDDLWVDRLNEDKGLDRVSNRKLLRLHDALTAVKSEFGSRAKLIDAILAAENRSKDADYRTRFESWPTPRLLDKLRAVRRS